MTLSTLRVYLGSAASKSNGSPADDDDDEARRVVSVASSKDVSAALADVTPSSLDVMEVFVLAEDLSSHYDPTALSDWVSTLSAGATVSIHVLGDHPTGADDYLQPIHTSFLLAGLAGASERRENTEKVVTATRKIKNTTAAPLPLKTNNRVVLDDLEDDELIDEDGLLSEEGLGGVLAPPPEISEKARLAADDCGGRKPCDNCTCGRAEREGGGEANNESKPKQVPTSSCGNCALGDAFRCANCPYLGKPAFKPGEEHLVLDLTDDL